ncbi:dihydrodipicolinate synthase family protein [Sphingomonas sp. BT-65]|uniref:dihydrodipicolinate synthase family protein n=1 Tax=Sphingomonas sp. BT-65 TaxID=2989821 RepID=UPI0022366F2B|nr:dihydrodipicolinate synthase family protein [Sphingomonas sp. BT-65]MCW4462897.1 dihydrodipicolinate synthase family protein [Sphingomonas sp. BT-65]
MNDPLPIRGVFSASFTAFDAAGAVDCERTAAHARNLIEAGCDGIALLGTTGEANSLSLAERKAVLESVVDSGVDPERLVPGTGVCSAPETIELTRHAHGCGVRTVLLLPPFYYPSPSEEGLYAHYARVLDACAAPGPRVMLYHIPQMSGVPITHKLIERLLAAYPGAVIGVKDSSGDLEHMRGLVAAFPGLAVFAGADHLLGPLMRAGGAGCITATSNLIAPWLAELAREIAAGASPDATRALEERITAARNLFQRWPQIAALKAAHAQRTGHADWAAVRPPWLPIEPRETEILRAAMADVLPDSFDLQKKAPA